MADASLTAWWQTFGDATLNSLIDVGLAQNLDIQVALQRIETARAAAGLTGINAQAAGGVSAEARRIDLPNDSITTPQTASADAIFVFDLFGEFIRGRRAAEANIEAAQFDSGAVRLAFLAELIDAYNSARFFQQSAAITRGSIANRREVLALVERRAAAEDATALEIAQAKALLATAEANLPLLLGRYQENVFRIATLVAQPGALVLDQMNRSGRQLRPRGSTKTGMPADIIRNRPDVRRAERELAAATERVGVAEARLLPSLTLDGIITAGDIDSWSFGPTLFLPIFNRGLLTAQRDVALSRTQEAELVWRASVLNAVEDVQSGLVLVRQSGQQVGAFQRAVSASDEVLSLSERSYEVGAATLLDIIDAETRLFTNRLALASAVRTWTSSYVQLQVGAGKGWLVGAQQVYVIKRPDGKSTFDYLKVNANEG